jgi:hypothetical protein
LKSGWWRDSLRGFGEGDKIVLVFVQSADEFGEVLVALKGVSPEYLHKSGCSVEFGHAPRVAH